LESKKVDRYRQTSKGAFETSTYIRSAADPGGDADAGAARFMSTPP
jgi:hypothetical protein